MKIALILSCHINLNLTEPVTSLQKKDRKFEILTSKKLDCIDVNINSLLTKIDELKIAFQWQGEALAAGDLWGHNFISGRFSYFSHPGHFKSQTLAVIHQIGLCCPSELFWKKFHAIHTHKKHRMQASSSDDSMWWFSNIWSSPIDTFPKWSNMYHLHSKTIK